MRAMTLFMRLLKAAAVISPIAFAVSMSPARADEMPACSGQSLGAAACFSGKLCECIYDRGGTATATPEGFRWDCGVLRPKCGEAAGAPATIDEYDGPFPLAIGIDRPHRGERDVPADVEHQFVR